MQGDDPALNQYERVVYNNNSRNEDLLKAVCECDIPEAQRLITDGADVNYTFQGASLAMGPFAPSSLLKATITGVTSDLLMVTHYHNRGDRGSARTSFEKRVDMFKFLLGKGANPSIITGISTYKEDLGWSPGEWNKNSLGDEAPLHTALGAFAIPCVKLLLDGRANPNVSVNYLRGGHEHPNQDASAQLRARFTPLHVLMDHYSMLIHEDVKQIPDQANTKTLIECINLLYHTRMTCQLLLEHKADPTLRDGAGETPSTLLVRSAGSPRSKEWNIPEMVTLVTKILDSAAKEIETGRSEQVREATNFTLPAPVCRIIQAYWDPANE